MNRLHFVIPGVREGTSWVRIIEDTLKSPRPIMQAREWLRGCCEDLVAETEDSSMISATVVIIGRNSRRYTISVVLVEACPTRRAISSVLTLERFERPPAAIPGGPTRGPVFTRRRQAPSLRLLLHEVASPQRLSAVVFSDGAGLLALFRAEVLGRRHTLDAPSGTDLLGQSAFLMEPCFADTQGNLGGAPVRC